MRSRVTRLASLFLLLLLVGCSGYRNYQKAQLAEQYGDWDQAVMHYLQLIEEDPTNVHYRAGLLRVKIRASQMHFEKGKAFHEAGALERALSEYQQAVELDPTNQYARVEHEKLRNQIRSNSGSRPSVAEMKEQTRGSRPQPPMLNPRSSEPISLAFPKPVSIFDIYRALGKAFGINVLFDPKLRPQELSIELQDVVAQDALEMIMRAATHFYKVLDEHTIIVAEDNAQNRRVYEDQVIQTFFLSNAEVKDVMTILRSLVGSKNVAQNEQLNAIVLRDNADRVKIAERIIETNDKSRGEVVIDVELLQINTSKLREIGVSLSDYSITQSLEPNPIRVSDLEFLNQGNWLLSVPSFIYQFVKNNSEAQLLASPQIRISDGEQAQLHIGDRVPVPVTTFNTGSTVGGNVVPITSFQYQDIGIRLDIEPRLHHNKEVTLKLRVEVSNLSGSISGAGGQEQPIIGTRTIESTIRLQNGETNFLAGLYQTTDQDSEVGVPGLSDIPVIGRLFSKTSTDTKRSDLVLTLTPHIIRTPDITEEDLLPIWVGTEANMTFRGGSPRVESQVEGPFDENEAEDAERIREMIRRRIQNLPRGLRDAGGEGEEAEEQPEGIDLVPSSLPQDIFRRPEAEEGEEEGSPQADLGLSIEPDEFLELLSGDIGEPAETQSVMAEAPLQPVAKEALVPVRLRLLPETIQALRGGTVDLELEIEANEPVSHVPITLRFNSRLLEVVSVEAGDFLGGAENSKVLADFSTPGKLVLGASRLGGSRGVVGKGSLATIRFRSLAEGRAKVRFRQAKALDPRLELVKPLVTDPAWIETGAGLSNLGGAGSVEQLGAADSLVTADRN